MVFAIYALLSSELRAAVFVCYAMSDMRRHQCDGQTQSRVLCSAEVSLKFRRSLKPPLEDRKRSGISYACSRRFGQLAPWRPSESLHSRVEHHLRHKLYTTYPPQNCRKTVRVAASPLTLMRSLSFPCESNRGSDAQDMEATKFSQRLN
jgi:hypothetical protein